MAEVKLEMLPKKQAKLTITVSSEEMHPFLISAAEHLSEHAQIPGFRKGKADYESVKRHLGEMKIYEEALEPIVRHTYVKAILDHDLQAVGSPNIHIEKMAPGNELVFIAEISLMPQVIKLAEYEGLSFPAKPITVEEKDVEYALNDLKRLQTKEIRAEKDTTATNQDKVVVDMQIKKEGVPIEGGDGKDHSIYLNESYYIPGFIEQIIGIKEGEQKNFQLTFPKEHYQKHLAGVPVDFEVTIKEILHLEYPAINDDFAVSLGQKDLSSLQDLLKQNMTQEKEEQEHIRQEKMILEEIASKSQFEDLPDLLINEEIEKMLEELKRGIERQGLEFDQYLKKLGKTLGELKLDFTPEAIKRIKIALVIQDIAKKEKIIAEPEEVEKEIEKQKKQEAKEEIKKYLSSPIYRQYLETMIRNKKVIDLLRKRMIT
ncbi:trigger factor [Candidatus Uhrbacteria bacterium CG_4_9_14_3_um_filter_36_7]|uniref:Trigger factor n=1 Tax=Candidatus Uhrbacteria bacterium CG_4_9_14_3_um_filter_36_7 TaxID=1975033 RepID=A0A2M7XFU7_9BACT|nr:MAG: trigger factor [Candidatus Uhrbacteria bacterium CG_4_9_14_3_um_filter_36_7]